MNSMTKKEERSRRKGFTGKFMVIKPKVNEKHHGGPKLLKEE